MTASPESQYDSAGEGASRALGRVLDVLESVVERDAANLTAVAQATGLTPTTALRHLRGLEQRGYVTRTAAGTYRCGPALTRVAAAALRRGPDATLVSAAQPELDDLAARAGESAYLAIRAGAEAVYVATAESHRTIRHVGWAGKAVPLAGTAVGAVLDGAPGVVVRTGAVEPDITAASIAINGPGGTVAALSVVGPAHRMHGPTLATIHERLVAAAGRLSGLAGGGVA